MSESVPIKDADNGYLGISSNDVEKSSAKNNDQFNPDVADKSSKFEDTTQCDKTVEKRSTNVKPEPLQININPNVKFSGSLNIGAGSYDSDDGGGTSTSQLDSPETSGPDEFDPTDSSDTAHSPSDIPDTPVTPKVLSNPMYEDSEDELHLLKNFDSHSFSPDADSAPLQTPVNAPLNDVLTDSDRPDSLSLPKPMQFFDRQKQDLLDSDSDTNSLKNLESVIQAITEAPLHEQGSFTKDGDRVAFVAEDINDMIKMSSPLSSTRGSRSNSVRSFSMNSLNSYSSLTSSYCSTSVSGMSRSSSLALQPSPDDIPPIDPYAIQDLETHARRVADNMDLMMGNLRSSLHKMSAITANCLETYSEGVDKTCDSVDACIKSMYALMAKSEEVSKSMRPMYKIADQIKEIKRLLDMFEAQMAKDKDEAR